MTDFSLYLSIFFTILAFIKSCKVDDPIIPKNFMERVMRETRYARPEEDQLIPKNLWIGFREVPPPGRMYPHMITILLSALQEGWTISLMDDVSIDDFMSKYYSQSSIYWAYHKINNHARIAASDIWRYCALYAFGGFYLDDDANINMPLSRVSISYSHSEV